MGNLFDKDKCAQRLAASLRLFAATEAGDVGAFQENVRAVIDKLGWS